MTITEQEAFEIVKDCYNALGIPVNITDGYASNLEGVDVYFVTVSSKTGQR